ncbi:phosphodiesterase, MJ0936 family [Methanohalobium evestigatum Z-7303]|uniref:Phosphoesterase n=1 Tax=Methanohalobium evestigatum (strain ATCC BAA-1072 / DSM 3721 / NBRC 107634 / OCM 161 / Z-7303) TaxID=644295 RepID=D7EA99_METEZ|nr:metallophosphoesterase [Methanohalobium evestigatum]ADI74770.1 phosphodiesterase, MJ0936 family [Methanohalobium evestigatum Z-7303]
MKIFAISDTHMKQAQIPQNLTGIIDDYDIIIHAGDFTSKGCYDEFESTGKLKAVYGNADDPELKEILPERTKFEIDGVRVGIIHQGALSVTDTLAYRYLALEMEVDVLVFGHLHRPIVEKEDVMLVCPGSPTKPRMSPPTGVEITIENGSVTGNIIELEGGSCDSLELTRKFMEEDES